MTSPITSTNATRVVCELRDWKISNLELHKILYIAHGTYMARMGTVNNPLIKEIFQAWAYGPVVPSLYHKFKMFGSDYIQDYVTRKYEMEKPDYDNPVISHIKEVIELLEGYEPWKLVSMTHKKGGAWRKNYSSKERKIIFNRDIFNEYKTYGR